MGTMCECIDRKSYNVIDAPLGNLGRVIPKQSLFHLEVKEIPDENGIPKVISMRELTF